jgi:hypothetical protein
MLERYWIAYFSLTLSQRDLCKRLKLAKLKKRAFIQGISDVNTEALHMVPLHIKSR